MKMHRTQSRPNRLRRQCMATCTAALSLIAVSAHAQDDVDAIAQDVVQPIAGETPAREVSSPSPDGIGRLISVTTLKKGASNEEALSICDAAQAARARNSPAAPGLEAQCAAQPIDLNALAAKGEVVARQDPLATQLLWQQTDGNARLGFLFGMAVWDGHTAPGPGKDRIRNNLPMDYQGGFDLAAAFSLARNSNPELLRIGAAIAATDPRVARLRTHDPAILYRMGYDIATGIFGDPAKGAKGNTAIGPGSTKVRETLDETGKRAFDASMRLHLSRNYLAPRRSEAEVAEAVANANANVLANAELLISDYRRRNNLGPVALDPTLMRIATDHATRMADEDQLAHVLPGEGSFKQRLTAGNFQGTKASEALYAGQQTAVLPQVLESWVRSPEYNRNLLAPGVSQIGIFVAHSEPTSKYQAYWSLVLGEPSAALEAAPPPDDGAVEVPNP